MQLAIVIVLAVVAVAVLVIAASGFRIVRPFQQGLIEVLGKYRRTVSPGFRFVVPFVQKLLKVDMREQVADVPLQEVITKDNVVVKVDAVIYYEATDPVKLQYAVGNFILAVTKLAQTNLRNIVSDLHLDEVLVSRDLINSKLRQLLDDVTDKWGTRLVRVEIKRIEPPPDVTEAMHRQMKAERLRRAVVTKAEGEKRSTVLKAEGMKQSDTLRAEGVVTKAEAEKRSTILKAEGMKQSNILRAEAEAAEAEGAKKSAILKAEGVKQSNILRAEGEAEAIMRVAEADKYQKLTVAEGEGQAIERVFLAIHNGDPTEDLIAIRYLETLQGIADGQATKIFLPLDTSGVLGAVAAMGEMFKEGTGSASGDSRTD